MHVFEKPYPDTRIGTEVVQPPPAERANRWRPHGERVAGTARVSLPDFCHDVSRFSSVEFGVDLRDGSGAVAQNNAGGFDAKLPAKEGRRAVP